MKDVGSAELGTEFYDRRNYFNGQPTATLAIRQAAGANAALAGKAGITPLDVPVAEVRRELARRAAILPTVA